MADPTQNLPLDPQGVEAADEAYGAACRAVPDGAELHPYALAAALRAYLSHAQPRAGVTAEDVERVRKLARNAGKLAAMCDEDGDERGAEWTREDHESYLRILAALTAPAQDLPLDGLRPEVLAFARLMEAKLRKHDTGMGRTVSYAKMVRVLRAARASGQEADAIEHVEAWLKANLGSPLRKASAAPALTREQEDAVSVRTVMQAFRSWWYKGHNLTDHCPDDDFEMALRAALGVTREGE